MAKRDTKIARDIVVVGASAGGIPALCDVLKGLSADFPGSIFIVLHTANGSHLPQVLQRATALPVEHAVDGQRISSGRIMVAPPDQHLLLNDHHVILSRGPKQNNVRPAVDPLFASAARTYGQRVVGVVLSGTLDDGSAGLLNIKEAGGLAMVQHPEDAAFSGMPASAMAVLKVDYALTAAEIGLKLNELVKGSKTGAHMKKFPKAHTPSLKTIAIGETDPEKLPPGKRSELTCPECGGTLWEVREGSLLRFACHTGHAYSAQSMSEAQGDQVESAMWVAMRALKERAILCRKLAEGPARDPHPTQVTLYEKRAQEFEAQAGIIQRVLLGATPENYAESKGRLKENKSEN